MASTRFLIASLIVFFLTGCGTFSSTKHPNGAVELHKRQATKTQAATTAGLGGAAVCGAIANKTTKKKHRKTATVLAAATCGGLAYAGTRSGYDSANMDRLESHLRTIEKPGIRIERSSDSKVVSLVFEGQYLNYPGDAGVRSDLVDEIAFVSKTLDIFTSVRAVVATADPNDKNYHGVGYARARNWSQQITKVGKPGKRVQHAGLGNSPRGAITQIDFLVK